MDEGLIYDVGLHRGHDTAYYLHRGYRVVAIEANPLLVDQAREKFATDIAAGRLVILGVGVGPERGTATFWVNETHDEWSAFSKEAGGRDGTPCHPIEVECVTFDEILAEHGIPHYLKIDIEGHDGHCLSALSADAPPQYVSVEAHGPEYFRQLEALGYDSFKLVNQLDHNDPRSQTIQWRSPSARIGRNLRRAWRDLVRWTTGRPDRMRDGGIQRDGTWLFARGSSGPFGEDTPGPWRSAEDVAADLNAWYEASVSPESAPRTCALNPRGWYDLHATIR